MKNKLRLYSILLLAVFILSGCNRIYKDTSKVIQPPNNKNIPFRGVWKIEKIKPVQNTYNRTELNNMVGEVVQLDEERASLSNEICINPQYKSKRVDTEYYILYKYKINTKLLAIDAKEVEVISVSSEDKPFYEFIKYDKDKMLVYYEGAFLFLKKISDKVEHIDLENFNSLQNKSKINSQSNFQKSCLLLGLREKRQVDNKGELGEAAYRTLWISADGTELTDIHERDNILVPRMTGFWELVMKRDTSEDFVKEQIVAYPYDNKNSFFLMGAAVNTTYTAMRNILFVGNDYIATEYYESKDKLPKNFNRFQVLPIDNLINSKGIKISDVAGEQGHSALITSSSAFITSNSKDMASTIEQNVNEESFTMARRNGHWILKGRLNSMDSKDYINYYDFNINLLPPKKLVNYDDLYVSWNSIKWRVPEAVDGFTSPNSQIAVIVTKNSLYIYGINHGELSEKPLRKVKINEGESVIMAEWATGEYVDKWEKIFKLQSNIVAE